MLPFLQENLGSILVLGVLIAVLIGITVHVVRLKRQGKSTCNACGNCPMKGSCHRDLEQ